MLSKAINIIYERKIETALLSHFTFGSLNYSCIFLFEKYIILLRLPSFRMIRRKFIPSTYLSLGIVDMQIILDNASAKAHGVDNQLIKSVEVLANNSLITMKV